VVLSAVYMLWMVQRVYYGRIRHEDNQALPDLLPREWAGVLPLCAAALLMGIFPTLFLRPMEASVERVVQRLQTAQTFRVENAPAPQLRPAPLPGASLPQAGR
jgi:NADH-quinone oxidoreductase subunit M